MRCSVRALVPLILVLLTSACHRPSGPSPEFTRAHDAFSLLYAQKLDEAFLDPAVPSILEDLHRVPVNSVDSAEAQLLESRITSGRARMLKDLDARAQASADARRPVDNVHPGQSAYPGEAPPPVEEKMVDAGLTQPAAGMQRAEFERRFLGCFQSSKPVDVQGRGVRDAYELKDIANCRDRHPGFDKSVVLVEGNQVLGVLPLSAIEVVQQDGGPVATDGGPIGSPDAGSADAGLAR